MGGYVTQQCTHPSPLFTPPHGTHHAMSLSGFCRHAAFAYISVTYVGDGKILQLPTAAAVSDKEVCFPECFSRRPLHH